MPLVPSLLASVRRPTALQQQQQAVSQPAATTTCLPSYSHGRLLAAGRRCKKKIPEFRFRRASYKTLFTSRAFDKYGRGGARLEGGKEGRTLEEENSCQCHFSPLKSKYNACGVGRPPPQAIVPASKYKHWESVRNA
jgi:hypothetical protein